MDTAQWPQGIGVVKPLEGPRPMIEKKPRPQKEQALHCPRCNATNTKFCYYNNYSLSQPRYFCKTCRRYWTEGGSLRSVPVGGGSRKNKRSGSSSSPSSSKKVLDLAPPSFPNSSYENTKIREGQDLNLAYPPTSDPNIISSFAQTNHSFLIPMPVSETNAMYPSGFSLQEFKPTIQFSMDGFGSGFGGLQGAQETSARLFFPFEDLKEVSHTSHELGQNREQAEPNGYWNGMLGGGTSW